MSTLRHVLTALTLLTVALVPAGARTARANGVPIRIPLTYLNGLSNTGTVDARGEAELSFAEALVKLDVRGLPRLGRGETYQIWLAKSGTNKAVAVGAFNTAADGAAGYSGKITGLDGYDYDLLILTVEPEPDTNPAPSDKRSIGGFFTAIKKQEVAASGINADTQPATLPNTGDTLPADTGSANHTLALVLFAFGGLLIYAAVKRWRNQT